MSEGWSYHGPRQRCAADDDSEAARACAGRMTALRDAGAEQELRTLAGNGERCAFVALMELLVDRDDVDALRELASAGDGRALATLMQLFAHQQREDELREEATRFGVIDWYLDHLRRTGRADEALAALDAWVGERPEEAGAYRGRRIDLLLEAGREDEVRRLAAAGDRTAARRLRR